MKVIYTANPTKERNIVFRDPKMFYGVIANAKEVIVEGDYPNIVEDYENIGIKVNSSDKKEGDKNPEDLTKLSVDDLKGRLTEAGITFDKSAKKDELIKLIQSSKGA